jgi:hypothetical protein
MRSSNIADSVFAVNMHYTDKQNKTKELFFECLNENRDLEYFNDKLREIWENEDYSFMLDEISEYETYIHEKNLEGKEITEVSKKNNIFDLVPLAVIIGVEKKFIRQKEKEYKTSQSYVNRLEIEINNATSETIKEIKEIQKQEYLKLKVQKYTDKIVPYYLKEPTTTGLTIRHVELSTYCSMIHNTNLTRTGWNQTLRDAELMGQKKFFIPYHPFSCPHCVRHQNKVFTAKEIMAIAHRVEEQQGDILHPNCKCVLTFYENRNQFNKPKYSRGELQEQYDIRQKTNSLTLKKEKVKTDMKIQKYLGNEDEFDKLNQQRNKINKEIRELKEALPTTSLKKQVVAINR